MLHDSRVLSKSNLYGPKRQKNIQKRTLKTLVSGELICLNLVPAIVASESCTEMISLRTGVLSYYCCRQVVSLIGRSETPKQFYSIESLIVVIILVIIDVSTLKFKIMLFAEKLV